MSSEILPTLHQIPGNDVCVDCHKPDPDWMSINLGIMMCIKCSGFHRNLGVHVTKIRSVDLDEGLAAHLDLFKAVGNRAFNRVWEAKVASSGAIRPQEYPSIGFIQQQFMKRKYDEKVFFKYDVAVNLAERTMTSSLNDHSAYQSFPTIISNDLPSTAIPRSEILVSRLIGKFGGGDHSFFHQWQPRYLIITHNGLIYYGKSLDDPPAGIISSPQMPTFEESRGDNYYYFGIPTHPNSEHRGRRFLFRCTNEESRLVLIEAIRKVLRSVEPFDTVEDHFGGPATTALEDTIDTLTRGFYRWYLDSISPPQPPSSPQTPESESVSDIPTPLLRTLSSSNSTMSLPSAPLPPHPAVPLYPPLTILKEGILFYHSNATSSWVPRYCVLTNEAFYISSYVTGPVHSHHENASSSPASNVPRRTSVTSQPPVMVTTLSTAQVQLIRDYKQEPSGPPTAFVVQSCLSYGLLGSDQETTRDWVFRIITAMKESPRLIEIDTLSLDSLRDAQPS